MESSCRTRPSARCSAPAIALLLALLALLAGCGGGGEPAPPEGITDLGGGVWLSAEGAVRLGQAHGQR